MESYQVSFTYPDGHVEDLDQDFVSVKAAVEYGVNLLNQVRATEINKVGSKHSVSKAYFVVRKIDENGRKIVFNSRSI